jgi:ABC-type sulfate/molybdate transport systems ATPase subunit
MACHCTPKARELVVGAAGLVHGATDITSLPPERRRIGLVFQDAALFPHLTVRDNVRLGPRAPPRPDHPIADLSRERIKRRPVLGGLLNEYERTA